MNKTRTNQTNLWLITILTLICIGLPIGIRLIELPKWNNPAYEISGEKIMATHDAYYFLASAIGTSHNPKEPLGILVRTLSYITHIPPATLGFFIPAIFCSLLAIPIIFWAYTLKIPEGALPASILGSCCLGYLGRSRLGYLDTDFGAISLSVALCCGIAIWIDQTVRKKDMRDISSLVSPIFIGIIGYIYTWFYGAGKPIVLIILTISFISSIIINKKNNQPLFKHLTGFLIIYIFSFDVIIGCIVALILYILSKYLKGNINSKILYIILLIGIVITSISSDVYLIFYNGLLRILSYSKIFSFAINDEKKYNLLLPSVVQSIREAQNISITQAVYRMASNYITFILGLIGFIYLVIKRPSSLVFILFLLLGISSTSLGNRFAMYGGVAIGIGLGFGLGLFFKNFVPNLGRWLIQIGITILILIPIVQIALKFKPYPIIPKIYAKTFKEVSKIAPKDSRLWQWWDYGYAEQYFAKRASFGDGGIHDGPTLYPLALVHTSNSPMQASQLIKFITLNQIKEYKRSPKKYNNLPKMWRIYLTDPMLPFSKMGAENASVFIQRLKDTKLSLPKIPPQYLVLSWENLKLAYWISYFGSWDITTGEAFPGKIQAVRGNISINTQDGYLFVNKKKINLDGLIIIDPKHRIYEFSWQNGTDIYGVLNELSYEMFLMDSTIYYSNMVQMLLLPPKKFSPYFKLVIDHSPWTRVYKVN